MEVESGLDEKKGLEILALYTETKLHGLPEEARCIVRECKGTKIHKTFFYVQQCNLLVPLIFSLYFLLSLASIRFMFFLPGSPLVVSLIGALLRDKPNRWSYYLRQLQQKQFKRIRKSSSYDYDALDQAMAASIEVLPEEHRELYKDLTVLEKDVKIPAKVFFSHIKKRYTK